MKNNIIIIAEAGVNHNGSVAIAKELVDAAVNAGADFVKFQTFITELNISKKAEKADYQSINITEIQETQYEMVKKLELSFNDFVELKKYCDLKGIGFLSTAFDLPSIDFLESIGQIFYKIASSEITNLPYLKYIASKGKPIVLSTGMADLGEIEDALNIMINEGLKLDQITILHCNTEYPTPMKDVNLYAMITIKEAFKVNVGYSDHTIGIEVPIAAVALGAQVIEKHFTLNRNLPGPDHQASIEPNELKQMVKAIRNIELAISGDGRKCPSDSEKPNKQIARKSIHINQSLSIGTVILNEHLAMKRPGDGISPMMLDVILGRTIKHDLPADHKLDWKDLG